MCLITEILGLLGVIIAIVLGGATTIVSGIVLGSTCCLGTCGVMGVIIYIVGMLCGGSVLAVFGISIADIMTGSTVGGYLGYLGTFIEQGGNLYDACRICIAGK